MVAGGRLLALSRHDPLRFNTEPCFELVLPGSDAHFERSAQKMTEIKSENFWFNEVQLSDGEEVILTFPSNHTQGMRAVGGKLFVTKCRIAFAPNRIDANLGGKPMEILLSEIDSIGTDAPRIRITEIFSGAWRTRLAIQRRNKVTDFFVVGCPETVASQINKAIRIQAEQGGVG